MSQYKSADEAIFDFASAQGVKLARISPDASLVVDVFSEPGGTFSVISAFMLGAGWAVSVDVRRGTPEEAFAAIATRVN